jgi:hypothetical protein
LTLKSRNNRLGSQVPYQPTTEPPTDAVPQQADHWRRLQPSRSMTSGQNRSSGSSFYHPLPMLPYLALQPYPDQDNLLLISRPIVYYDV